jgi:hypothetical protein
MPKEEGEIVVDPALAIVEIGVADAARLDRHRGLARTGIGDEHRLDRNRRTLGRRNHTSSLVHEALLPDQPPGWTSP